MESKTALRARRYAASGASRSRSIPVICTSSMAASLALYLLMWRSRKAYLPAMTAAPICIPRQHTSSSMSQGWPMVPGGQRLQMWQLASHSVGTAGSQALPL